MYRDTVQYALNTSSELVSEQRQLNHWTPFYRWEHWGSESLFHRRVAEAGLEHRSESPKALWLVSLLKQRPVLEMPAFEVRRVVWPPYHTLFSLLLPHQSWTPGRERWGNLLFPPFEPRRSIKFIPVLKCLQSFCPLPAPPVPTLVPVHSGRHSLPKWQRLALEKCSHCVWYKILLSAFQILVINFAWLKLPSLYFHLCK